MDPKALRKQAEEITLTKNQDLKKLSTEEIQHLVHELHTHQIELEIQNEELRKTQEQLRKSYDRYSSLYNSAPVGYLTLNDKGVIIEANHTICDLLSLPCTKLIGSPFTDLIAHDSQDIFYQLKRVLLKNKTPQNCNIQLNHPFQKNIWVLLGCNVIMNDLVQIQEIRMSVSDITDYMTAQEELNKLSKALQYSGEGVMIVNRDSKVEYINPAFTKITGYISEEVLGKQPDILKSHTQPPALYNKMWDTVNSGQAWSGSVTNRKKDGTDYPAILSIVPIQDHKENITHSVATLTDMTEYRRLETQLHQAQKMEAIGVLVGGIAHDFNNMLAAIIGNVELAKHKLATDDPVMKNINSVHKLCARAAGIIQQLLTFARKDQVVMSDFSINAFLTSSLELIRLTIPENITHELNVCSEELFVHANSTLLQRVMMNLLNNARDALDSTEMPKIICSLQPYYADDAFKQRHPNIKSNKFALLSIEDNGVGIPHWAIENIFEPFYTNKEVDKGTGLGLAMVYGAIETHKGVIEVDSEVGKGTVFKVYLPGIDTLKDKQPLKKEQSLTAKVKIVGNEKLILVADDNEQLREILEDNLINLGYRVITAVDGEDAYLRYKKNKDKIALVVLDVVMPKMNGVDAAIKIRRLNSTTPVIFVTGYYMEGAMNAQKQVEHSVVLSKPFSSEKLSETIFQLLES